jgi:hypothetical protein
MDMAVQIDDRPVRLLAPIASPPDRLLSGVDRTIQSPQAPLIEAPQEVPGRRRVGNPRRAQHPAHRLARLQMSDVLDARAAHEQVVDVGQDVVRLREGPMRLQEIQCLIERTVYPEAP